MFLPALGGPVYSRLGWRVSLHHETARGRSTYVPNQVIPFSNARWENLLSSISIDISGVDSRATTFVFEEHCMSHLQDAIGVRQRSCLRSSFRVVSLILFVPSLFQSKTSHESGSIHFSDLPWLRNGKRKAVTLGRGGNDPDQ